jgi:CRISPR-associated protein Cas1
LPKVRDSWSHLYVEHARVDQDDKAIAVHDQKRCVPVPCAALSLLMHGPGTTITHAAIRTLMDCGWLVVWVGEHGVRFYAQGLGETRSARNLLRQAALCSDPAACELRAIVEAVAASGRAAARAQLSEQPPRPDAFRIRA